MKLTKEQNQKLDSLKSQLERLEKRMEEAGEQMNLAIDLEDDKAHNEYSNLYSTLEEEHISLVKIEAKSWKVDPTLMLDLIFDREHTLRVIDLTSKIKNVENNFAKSIKNDLSNIKM